MEPPWSILFLIVILVGLVLALGWVARQLGGMIRRQLRDRQPVRQLGPAGEFIHIPAMNVKQFRPNWLYRSHHIVFHRDTFRRRARFRIYASAVEYGWSRQPTTVPFHAIELVDALPGGPGPKAFTLHLRGEPKPVAVLTTTAEAARHALWLLAHHCRLTDRARASIGAQPPVPTALLGR